MAGDPRKLKVFQRAYRLSLELHRASLGWPRVEQYGGVADQLRRASKSVCALLVEGAGRQPGSDAEFRRYLLMAVARRTKRGCGATTPSISDTRRVTSRQAGAKNSPKSPACCTASETTCLKTDD